MVHRWIAIWKTWFVDYIKTKRTRRFQQRWVNLDCNNLQTYHCKSKSRKADSQIKPISTNHQTSLGNFLKAIFYSNPSKYINALWSRTPSLRFEHIPDTASSIEEQIKQKHANIQRNLIPSHIHRTLEQHSVGSIDFDITPNIQQPFAQKL